MEERADIYVGYLTGPDPNEGGMCAYASDINQIWCCNVGEQ